MVAEHAQPVTWIGAEDDRRVCNTKVRHKTKAEARAARSRESRLNGHRLHIYECPTCDGFHLTTMPPQHERRRRRAAAAGELVKITYDAPPGVTLELGDGLRTGTGRTYLIVGIRVQDTGMHKGRYHLQCAVEQPIPGRTFLLVWYKR